MNPWFAARGRVFLMTSALLAALGAAACSGGGPARPGADDPSGGTGGDEGPAGTGGSKATGGSTGSGGSAGSNGTGSGGSPGTGGFPGTGGSPGTGGAGGKADAGVRDAGVRDAGAADAAPTAPTFTQVYAQIMSSTPAVTASSCWGPCHAGPGTAKAMAKIDMTTQEKAYPGVMKLVMPGNATRSKLYMEINTGAMPEKRPKLPANLIQMLAAWINAGAMNN
jgi:hypothetical protein